MSSCCCQSATFLFLVEPAVCRQYLAHPEGGPGDIGGIPAFFLLKTIIPAMTMLLFLPGFAEYHRRICAWPAG